jgi:SAM-dependent methyltransferase
MDVKDLELQKYYKYLESNDFYKNAGRLKFYMEHYLFKDVDFKGKRFLDIGGGRGIFGFYAAIQGAADVVIMEPEFDGSTDGVEVDFYKIKKSLGLDNISFSKELIQNYQTDQKFDIIMLHNSINHLNENICEELHLSEKAKEEYIRILKLIAAISNPACRLIITDCSRRSLYSDLGLTNPFAKTIEWNKHQSPSLWSSLLEKVGFEQHSTKWTSYNILKKPGRLLTGNRLFAYLTFSHFKLDMIYKG